jgi:hypothetical protein
LNRVRTNKTVATYQASKSGYDHFLLLMPELGCKLPAHLLVAALPSFSPRVEERGESIMRQ